LAAECNLLLLLLLLLLKSIFKCRAVKKLLEHFTEVKKLMAMSHVRVCEYESFEMSLEDRQ